MHGGEALTRLHTSSGIACAAMDQNNAFTRVRILQWMVLWCATIPVRAFPVCAKFSEEMRSQTVPAELIYPCYCGLAMGGSHSVYILMATNLYQIGKALTNRRNLQLHSSVYHANHDDVLVQTGAAYSASLGDKFFFDDELETSEAWLLRSEAWLNGANGATGFTLEGWARAVHNSRLTAYSSDIVTKLDARGLARSAIWCEGNWTRCISGPSLRLAAIPRPPPRFVQRFVFLGLITPKSGYKVSEGSAWIQRHTQAW